MPPAAPHAPDDDGQEPDADPVPGVGGTRRTGRLPLRPLSTTEVLDHAVRLFRGNAGSLVAVMVLFLLPVQGLIVFLQREALARQPTLTGLLDPAGTGLAVAPSGSQTAAGAVAFVVSLFILPAVAGIICRIGALAYVGRQAGVVTAWRQVRLRWASLVVAWSLILAGVLLGLWLFVVPAVALATLTVAVAPAVVVEDRGPIEAFRRSFLLVRPRALAVLGTLVLAGLLVVLAGFVLRALPELAVFLLFGRSAGRWVAVALGSVLGGAVTFPFLMLVATVLYLDVRVRSEPFDLDVLAVELDQVDGTPP